jgi:hypothetical protein
MFLALIFKQIISKFNFKDVVSGFFCTVLIMTRGGATLMSKLLGLS